MWKKVRHFFVYRHQGTRFSSPLNNDIIGHMFRSDFLFVCRVGLKGRGPWVLIIFQQFRPRIVLSGSGGNNFEKFWCTFSVSLCYFTSNEDVGASVYKLNEESEQWHSACITACVYVSGNSWSMSPRCNTSWCPTLQHQLMSHAATPADTSWNINCWFQGWNIS